MASTSLSPSSSDINDTVQGTSVHQTLVIINYCIGSLGLIGNILVMIVLSSSSTLKKIRTNKLIMNQSIIDFLGSLFLILTTAINPDIQGNFAYCVIWVTKLPFWALMVSSTYSLLLITIERYLGVVHSSWYKRKITDRHMIFSISMVLILVIVKTSSHSISSSNIDLDGSCMVYSVYSSLNVKRAVGVFIFTVNFLIPIVVHVFCYSRMFYTLWICNKNGVDICMVNEGDEDNLISNRKEMRNVVVTLITITVCFVSCWFCNQFYFLLSHFSYQFEYTSNFYHFTVIAVFCNCCINPIVYALKYKQFQEHAKKIICSFRKDKTAKRYERKIDSGSTIYPSGIVCGT